ncbi:hypothetical protein ABB02_00699 [Clostridiaceae bacterium JG1575]|nr:hypothetical protein ABB02_00699 [Clostridiaceae bacterium JG1575]
MDREERNEKNAQQGKRPDFLKERAKKEEPHDVAEAFDVQERQERPPKQEGFFRTLFSGREEEHTHFEEPMPREDAHHADQEAPIVPLFREDQDRVLARESTKHLPEEILDRDRDEGRLQAREMERSGVIGAKEARRGEKEASLSPSAQKDWAGSGSALSRKRKRMVLGALVLLAVLLVLFAPHLQKAMFASKDVLLFVPGKGLFGPRAALIEIALGILGVAITLNTLWRARKSPKTKQAAGKTAKNPFLIAGLVLGILLPIGLAGFLGYTELRQGDLRFSTIFNSNQVYGYQRVTRQDITKEGKSIYYTLTLDNGIKSRWAIAGYPKEAIRSLDAKLPVSRNVGLTSDVIQALVEEKLYTNEEVLRIFLKR